MQSRQYEHLIIEAPRPEVLRITINRPSALNALNRAVVRELTSAVEDLEPAVRVVVLTGAGPKAFVAGADIQEMAQLSPAEAAAFSRAGHALGERLEQLDAVVIAEVNGYALGGGCELMLACDFAIGADTARLGQPEVGLGVTPGFGGTTRLVRRIGPGRARQLLYTGEQIKADEAKAIGLLNEVVPAAELRARVDAIADRILQNAPVAVKLTKRAVNLAAEAELGAANAFEQQVFGLCFATEDQREGMKAFGEKRKPAWKGR